MAIMACRGWREAIMGEFGSGGKALEQEDIEGGVEVLCGLAL
jgi:hypothetical protein